MEKLLKETTAYAVLTGDRRQNRLSHAYMLIFRDAKNLRAALGVFALAFFGFSKDSSEGARVLRGSYADAVFYPEEGKKITADGVAALIADSALRPVEGDRKLYVVCGFESASALVQNKLLKTLEEPPEGVCFLLGATSAAPVLDTVKSRVKTLEIPPFSKEDVLAALERQGRSDLNAAAAASCGGVLGDAENMVGGGWFRAVMQAAEEVCFATRPAEIGAVTAKYGDVKNKRELLAEMQRLYFTALTKGGSLGAVLKKPALLFALERLDGVFADVKFNANFQGLLYDFLLEVSKENEKWHKLQA